MPEVVPPEDRMLGTQLEQFAGEIGQVAPGLLGIPVHPGDGRVLTVGVVVALLGAAQLVPAVIIGTPLDKIKVAIRFWPDGAAGRSLLHRRSRPRRRSSRSDCRRIHHDWTRRWRRCV